MEAVGTTLEGAMAPPALGMALRELPKHLPDSSQHDEDLALQAAILQCVRYFKCHLLVFDGLRLKIGGDARLRKCLLLPLS